MNLFKCVREFQIELEFGSVGFWGEGKTGVPGEKPSGTNERTNNKLNPHMASTPGFEPGPHWWEESASHHCATLAPQRAYSGLFFAWNSTTPDFIEYNRKTFISLSSLQSCINTITCNQNLRQPPGLPRCRSMQLRFIRKEKSLWVKTFPNKRISLLLSRKKKGMLLSAKFKLLMTVIRSHNKREREA